MPPGALIVGVDEAGRGPWAGPVTAAAVALTPGEPLEISGDSKALTPRRRTALAARIRASAVWGLGWAEVAEIDALGLGRAADLAMCRALAALPRPPDFALIDGARLPKGISCQGLAVVKGDTRCRCVAAASILAKTARDALMDDLAAEHPGYGWESNRGYGAPAHQAALRVLGVTPHHRRSFAPIHKMLSEDSATTP